MPEKERIHNHEFSLGTGKAVLWDSLKAARLSGASDRDILRISTQISTAVNLYNDSHPSEMLRKTPESIVEQFELGRSCIIAVRERNGWEFGYHGSIYPMFENGEERITGTQLVELGTDITNERYRGQGLGQLGLQTRLQMLDQWRQPGVSVFGLATVKRLVTGYVYGKMDAHPVSYWDHPYVAYLTDTCENSSERYGHQNCEYRRQPGDSNRESLKDLFHQIGTNAYIPCTVVVTDRQQAREFDDKMRGLHQAWLGQSIPVGTISQDAYHSIGQFYDEVARRAQTR